jgi:hypothetical protein
MTIKNLKYILKHKDLQEELLNFDENYSIIFTDSEIIVSNTSEQEYFNALDDEFHRQEYKKNHPTYIN